jgi:hypothetical protein
MGYSTNPGLVEGHADILRQIKTAIDLGVEIRFKIPPDQLSSEQYRLRRILKAADVHKTACGGEFAGLGSLVTLSLDAEREEIVVRSRYGRSLGRASAEKGTLPTKRYDGRRKEPEHFADENDALEVLRKSRADMQMLEFSPSPEFDEPTFRQRAESIGWILTDEPIIVEDGSVIFGAERKRGGGFSTLTSG